MTSEDRGRKTEDRLVRTASRFFVTARSAADITVVCLLSSVLWACGSAPKAPVIERQAQAPAAPTGYGGAPKPGGGYYLNDGPGDNPPPDLGSVPDAVPRAEPLRKANMRAYTALGKTYTPLTELGAYKERGIASWYGRRYHGLKTASGEIYDMYAMTAAHTTLPLPSYARVTNVKNGKQVVVRVNDRGPFHSDRLIDLSYTAAYKLGVLGGGSAMVEVESLLPHQMTEDRGQASEDRRQETEVSGVSGTSCRDKNHEVVLTNLSSVLCPPSPDAGDIYLQLGAFGASDNAENFMTRIRLELAWLIDMIHVVSKDGLFRVSVGPYQNPVLAKDTADKIAEQIGIKPVIIKF